MPQRIIPYCFVQILVLFVLTSCQNEPAKAPPPQAAPPPNNATAQMVEELRKIAKEPRNLNMWHLNKERAQQMEQQLNATNDPSQKLSIAFRVATEWLNAGDYNKAIERLDYIFKYATDNQLNIPRAQYLTIKELQGMAYLRKGEIENCLKHHNAYSCLIPIEKPGQHIERDGAESAAKIFRSILEETPNNLQVRWLYNIAQMALGRYPNQVEQTYRIPPSIFESEAQLPRFTDKAMELGVAVNDISGSVVMDDFNNDYYPDLLVSSYGLDDQLRYFENDGMGGFVEKTEAAGLKGLWSGLNMVQADYDNDGWLDVLILRGAWLGAEGQHPNSLLRNNGDGTFSEVSRAAGVYSRYPTQTASWADFNGDGWLDLFIANEHSDKVKAPAQLFENNGDGTFKEVAQARGIAIEAYIKGCVWGDVDNDGYPDLYLSAITGKNYLMKNGGPEQGFRFSNIAPQAGVEGPNFSFPCWFFDYDQDGWEDIFVSGFDPRQFTTAAGQVASDYLGQSLEAELPRLYRNNGNGSFEEQSAAMGVNKVLYTMGCNYGDLNNDGFPDFYAATGTPDFRALVPNRMFLNRAGKGFADVSKAGGFGHLQKGHGIAFGDIDLDGDEDIYAVLGGSYDGDNFMNALFVNPGNGNKWLRLKLRGKAANASAIGSRVKISARNATGAVRTFYSTVSSGGSFGANSLCVEQGLGDFNQIEQVCIRWAGSQEEQILEGLKAGGFYLITQGAPKAERLNLKAVELKGSHDHHHHNH